MIYFLRKISFLLFVTTVLNSNEHKFELAIASMFRNEAPYLKEWIEYHRMVGVEHFWLYNHESNDNWEEILEPYIKEGLVEVFFWQNDEAGNHLSRQMEAFTNSMSLARDNTKWITFIDIDEFILPMKDKTIVECLNNHFSEASGVFVTWLNFGTSKAYVTPGEPFLFHLKNCSFKSYPKNGQGKSFFRPEDVLAESAKWMHYVPLKQGCIYMDGDRNQLKFYGQEVEIDWDHHDKYIRINHYFLRDENFYQNRRLKAAQEDRGLYSIKTLQDEHYYLSLRSDVSIMKFIKNNYPERFEKFWNKK